VADEPYVIGIDIGRAKKLVESEHVLLSSSIGLQVVDIQRELRTGFAMLVRARRRP
jgi:hypothetical protein